MMNDPKPFDISAEFLLNYLFPDHTDQWQAEYAGAFYRNYSPDILSFEKGRQTVRLSRDGFLRLLPQGIIAPDNILKGKGFEQKYEQLKKKEELLKDLFKPVDTLNFRFRLHIEKETSQLSSEKLALLLKYYFDYELEKEKNPYIRKTAPLLLLVSHLRADFSFLHTLLKCLFGCPVEMTTGRYTWDEGNEYSQPAITFQLIVPDLTTEAYNQLKLTIDPFADFIREWFIPFDTHCAIVIKHHNHPFVLGDALTLDYNTETHEHSSTQHIDTNRNPL